MKKLLVSCGIALTITAILAYQFYSSIQSFEWPSNRSPASQNLFFNVLNWVGNAPLGNRLNDYIEALGVQKTGAGNRNSNPGLIAYNNKLVDGNKCFANLASQFYSEIQNQDLIQIAKNANLYKSTNDFLLKRSTVSDKLTRATSPAAGYLWDLAIKYADGDANLAMHLIGVCGHDDVSIDIDLPPNTNNRISEQKTRLLKQIEKSAPQEVTDYLRFRTSKPLCPLAMSSMYFPGALGAEYDIPESLKERIIQAQAPTSGGQALPSKSYHVMGGALATCLLHERGVPSVMARKIHKHAANAYRSTTTCRNIKMHLSSYEELNEKRPQWQDELKKFIEEVKKNPKFCNSPNSINYSAFCNILTKSQVQPPPDQIQRRLESALANSDGAFLLARTATGKGSLDNCARIDLVSQLESGLSLSEKEKCPRSWDTQRCDNAKQSLKSWSVDFEWTRTQHLVGESFAADHCTNIGNKDPLQHSCEALEKLETNLKNSPNNKSLKENLGTR